MKRIRYYDNGDHLPFWKNVLKEIHNSSGFRGGHDVKWKIRQVLVKYNARIVPGIASIEFISEEEATLFLLRYA